MAVTAGVERQSEDLRYHDCSWFNKNRKDIVLDRRCGQSFRQTAMHAGAADGLLH